MRALRHALAVLSCLALLGPGRAAAQTGGPPPAPEVLSEPIPGGAAEPAPAPAEPLPAPAQPPLVAPAPPVPPQPPAARAAGKPGAEKKITLNFKDAELEAVVQFISEVTGKSFILDADQKARGKITVISPIQVTTDEAYEIFQAILNLKGYTIVPSGRLYKILPAQAAPQSTIETVQDAAEPGERIVTRIFQLKNVDANEMVQVISPLVSKGSPVIAYPPTNTLILIDSYANVERVLEIVTALDVPVEGTTLEIIPLAYASADVVAKNVLQAVTDRSAAGRRRAPARGQANVQQVQTEVAAVKIIADVRTNSLIVIADPAAMLDVKAMIRALDVEIPKGTGKINVHYLKYADAENVAGVLTAISKSAPEKGRPGAAAQAATPTVKAPADVTIEFEQPVQITADKATNSLVIIASPQDYELLKGVIDKLDIRRPQVLVDALLVEMDYEKAMELGMEWRSTNDPRSGDTAVVASSSFGTIGNVAAGGPLAVPQGLVLAAVKGTISFGGREFLNVAALARALQDNADVNIVSTPTILTTDNEEAEIVVSDNIPFKTSEKFDSNGNPISTFEYRDVGLTLRLTPQINEDNFVKLKIFQESSQILSTATGGSQNAPSTARRSTKTTVVVPDSTTVVIGGLIKDDSQARSSSVPCLGDLPVAGYLFRVSRNERRKTNLLIFLTPHIVTNPGRMEEVTRDKRQLYEEHARDPAATPMEPVEKLHRYLDRQQKGPEQ